MIFLACIGFGCAQKNSRSETLARIGDRFITLEDFKDRVSKLPQHYKTLVNKNKKKFLDDLIVDELFYEEAIRKGLAKDKETKAVINEAKKKILVAKLVQVEVEDKIRVNEDAMRSYYDEHKEQFMTPVRWRASHILVPTEEEAKTILADLAQGRSFEDLAKEKSQDGTASRGGDIGYFAKGHLIPEFETACLQLGIGSVSDIVKTKFGYHIIKLTDRVESQVEDFEAVKRSIKDILEKSHRRDLFNNLVNRLKTSYRVEVSDNVFDVLDSVATEEKPQEKSASDNE